MKGARKPIPSAIAHRAGNWKVDHSPHASVQLVERQMYVDTSNDHSARLGRLHEMMHAEISEDIPPSGPDMHPDVIQVVEDHRVWVSLAKAGFYADLQRQSITEHDLQRWSERVAEGSADPQQVAQGAIAWTALLDGELFEAAVSNGIDQCTDRELQSRYRRALAFRDRTRDLMDREYHRDPEATRNISRTLTPLYNALADPPPPGDNPGDMADPDAEEVDKGTEGIRQIYRTGAKGWCPMEIIDHPLPFPHPGKWKTQALKAKRTGTVPVNMARYCTDRRIFNVICKADGAPTILIDCSGSMHLDHEMVRDMARRFPYASIATYNSNGKVGRLNIIVARCRMADITEVRRLTGGYNGVDGPALEWLGKQEGPRVWISDGQVNGLGGASSSKLVAECTALCQRHRILRVPDMDSAVDFLERQRGKLRRTS